MIKSGFQSSEFYVALVGIASIMWQFFSAKCNINQTDLLTLAGIVIAYIVGRSWVKSGCNPPCSSDTTDTTSKTTSTTQS